MAETKGSEGSGHPARASVAVADLERLAIDLEDFDSKSGEAKTIRRVLSEYREIAYALQAVASHFHEPQCIAALEPIIRAAIAKATGAP